MSEGHPEKIWNNFCLREHVFFFPRRHAVRSHLHAAAWHAMGWRRAAGMARRVARGGTAWEPSCTAAFPGPLSSGGLCAKGPIKRPGKMHRTRRIGRPRARSEAGLPLGPAAPSSRPEDARVHARMRKHAHTQIHPHPLSLSQVSKTNTRMYIHIHTCMHACIHACIAYLHM